jgi:hypothetical protein
MANAAATWRVAPMASWRSDTGGEHRIAHRIVTQRDILLRTAGAFTQS